MLSHIGVKGIEISKKWLESLRAVLIYTSVKEMDMPILSIERV